MLQQHAVKGIEVVKALPGTLVCELERLLTCLCEILKHVPQSLTSEIELFFGEDASDNCHSVGVNLFLYFFCS